jgi:hypothetical protein
MGLRDWVVRGPLTEKTAGALNILELKYEIDYIGQALKRTSSIE